jgi:hypothetical protein
MSPAIMRPTTKSPTAVIMAVGTGRCGTIGTRFAKPADGPLADVVQVTVFLRDRPA